jgi:uncharacterized membrane-anchored protein
MNSKQDSLFPPQSSSVSRSFHQQRVCSFGIQWVQPLLSKRRYMQGFYYNDNGEIHFIITCLWQDTTLVNKKGAELDFEGNKKAVKLRKRDESTEKKVKKRKIATIENQDRQ